MSRKREASSGSNMIGLIVLGLLLALAGFGIGNYTGGKHAPHTTPGPGPSAPADSSPIDGTSVPCTRCSLHGIKSDNPVNGNGTSDCKKCDHNAIVDDSLPDKLSALSASAKMLVGDAISKAKDSAVEPLKIAPPQGAIVDLTGANGLQVEINGAQAGLGDAITVDKSKLPAAVQKFVNDAEQDGVKVLKYRAPDKGHLQGEIDMGNKECKAMVNFW